jgi:LPXTG-motif cell wall-anchored protein
LKSIRSRVRARLASAVAVAAAATLAFTGLPGLTSSADAAPGKPPKPGMLCRDYFDLAEDLVAIVEMPDGDASRAKSQWDTYEYENPGKNWDGLQGPSEADYKRLEKETKEPPKSRPVDRVWWKWIRASKKNPNAFGDFTYWRDIILIKNAGNDPRGKAFEKKIIKEHGLVGDDWICQKEFDYTDPDTGKTYRRQADAWNKNTGQALEIKSNGHPETKQKPGDIAWSKQKESPVKSLKYIFAEPQEKSAKDHLNELKKNAPGKVTEYNYRSRKVELAPGGGVRDKSTTMQPPGSKGVTGGGAQDLIRESRPNPKDMKEFLDRKNAADPNRLQPKGPGGVDFTTLELRYIGKPVKGKGVDYSFSAKEVPEDTAGWGGKAKSQLINDAFFTWLALDPSKFWVNLNPDQPDKIMDTAFGKTDAGRILLEADLEMKRDYASAMNPTKRPEADRFWKSMPRNSEGVPCWFSVRNWIEPATAVVREENGGIHILDTPLKVKAQYLAYSNMPDNGTELCDFDEQQKKWAEQQVNTLIIPEVEKQVNTSPRYADLRRVYTARVAAEFIRQQDAKAPTDYHKVINSNDVTAWPLRGENKDWTREKTYQAYLKSLRTGEDHWEHDAGGGRYAYGVGGVDLSKQPKRNMTKVRFDTEHRYLPRETKSSVRTLTDNAKDGEKNLLLLGGNTVSSDLSGGGDTPDPTPTPTPTPTKPGEPTDKPTDPTTPPATGGSSGGTGGNDPEGDLADTGSSTPVGLFAGLAAALAAIGGSLVWWKRRRTADQE